MKKPKKKGDGAAVSALVVADFANGSYQAGGASVAAADMFATDAEIGFTFDAGDIVSGLGLRGQRNGGTSVPAFIGPLRDALLGSDGSTVVIDFDCSAPVPGASFLGVDFFNSPDWDLDVAVSLNGTEQDFLIAYTASTAPPSGAEALMGAFSPGHHKVAITFTRQRVAVSFDGGVVVEIVPNVEPDWSQLNKAYLGNSFVADYIRSITVYAPAADTELPGLS